MKLFIVYIFCIGLWVYVAIAQPVTRNEDEWYKEQWPTQPYAFGYEIRDYSGNEQYRKEMSDGDRVTGSYGYLGPDGVFRHVEYTADENGFRAKIRTSEPGTANENPSNIEIESNPVRVLENPSQGVGSGVTPGVTPVVDYDNLNPGNIPIIPIQSGEGLRGDSLRSPDRSRIRDDFDENPNIRNYEKRPPTRSSLPRVPDRPIRPKPPLPIIRDIPNINRGDEVSLSRNSNPNIENPNVIRGGQRPRNRDRSNFGETPDNRMPDKVVPYRGANPKRPASGPPRGGSPQNQFDNRNFGSNFRDNQDVNSGRDPDFNRKRIRPPSLPPSPSPPSIQSFDRDYGIDDNRNVRRKPNIPNRNTVFDDNRGSGIGDGDGPTRGYDVQKSGPKRPTNSGFIEATKGPINRPIGGFRDNKITPHLFDDDNDDDYNEFKRRQDDRTNISDDPKFRRISPINRPVFEDRDSPQKGVGINRSRYDTNINDRNDGQRTKGPSNRESPLFNRTLIGKQDKEDRDDRDGRVRRPKVYITNGPISMNGDRDDDEPDQQRHIDVDHDDKDDDRVIKDPYERNFDGLKTPLDRNRPLRPFQKEQKPTQGLDPKLDVKPYFGGRQPDRAISPPFRPDKRPVKPLEPSPPYRQHIEQKHIQDSEDKDDIPVQRDDEFPPDQPLEPIKPQIYQPQRPDRPQISQPYQPRTPPYETGQRDSQSPKFQQRNEYKPRTQSRDRSYLEQKHIEIQPYQTQNTATISTPSNINALTSLYKPIELPITPEPNEKDPKDKSPNEPLSPSSYIVTPFSTATQSNPNIEPKLEITQMQIPKFGTRFQTESPARTSIQSTADITDEAKVQEQIDENENSNIDNLEEDQYYADEEQNEDIEEKESPRNNFSYSQTISQSSGENANIKTSTSSPSKIPHKFLDVANWQKYDHIDDSDWK